MNEQRYRAVIGWFQAHPAARRALYLVSRGAVAAVYLLYAVLLFWLAVWYRERLLPSVVVPAVIFWAGSALRTRINRPRPYTALGYRPLFPKAETGRSMPSRHCFSAAAIAVTAWHCSGPLGAVLTVLAVLIAASRVVTGVHYISDVLVGLAFGAGTALVGWQLFGLLLPTLL